MNDGSPSRCTQAPTISQEACRHPLANIAVPLNRKPPSTGTAFPVVGLSDPDISGWESRKMSSNAERDSMRPARGTPDVIA